MRRDGATEDRLAPARVNRPVVSDTTCKVPEVEVRFARAATRHRVSKDSIRAVIANRLATFEEPPPQGNSPGCRSPRLVFLEEDAAGRVLEAMAAQLTDDALLVIHAMPIREKYRSSYEEVRWTP
jgi:hypothetical protein